MKWKQKQKDELRQGRIMLDSDHWFEEDSTGLRLYCDAITNHYFVGTLSINSIQAYLRRWEKARKA